MTVKRKIPPIGAPWRGQRNTGKAENVRSDSANGASASEARTVAGSSKYKMHSAKTPVDIASTTAAKVSAAIFPDPGIRRGVILPSNDEVERRGVASAQNEADLSQTSTPSVAQRRYGPESPEPLLDAHGMNERED
jgi:hypothetical protein